MAELTINNIRKKYDKQGPEIVQGVNLKIKDKDFVVVVGPSGCGKSTFLRMVAGLERIDSGEIYIDKTLVNHLEPKDRHIAMVFQNYALYPHMNVFKNIAYALKITGVPKQEIEERVKKTAQILKLTPFLERKPNQLSGGQRQRVAMGRALIREPKVFLFDEPLSNLDAKLRVETRIEIKKLQRNLGVTSIFVTHDQVEAMTLADTLVVMHRGVFEQVGNPMDIYRKPATLFVAGFIGSPPMNLIKGVLENKQIVRLDNDFVLKLPLPFPQLSYVGKEIVIGIRAEHFRITPPTQGDLFLKIDVIEQLGDEEIFCGTLYNPKNKSTFQLNHSDNPQNIYVCFPTKEIEKNKNKALTPGGILPLKVDAGQFHFFDPQTERRIEKND